MIIPIVFSTDENYVLPLSVALKSVINSKAKYDELDVYVFYSKLSKESQNLILRVAGNGAKVTFTCVDEYVKGVYLYEKGNLTVATYYRFFAPIILSNYKKILYLDCDIIVKNSLAEFYSIDMGDNIIAGPKFIHQTGELLNYFNAGVIAINVEEYNKNNVCQKSLDYINAHRNLEWLDETVLNKICKGKVKFIHHKFNFQTTYAKEKRNLEVTQVKSIKDIVIIHYTEKPWKFVNTILADYWWKTVKTMPKEIQNKIDEKFSANYIYDVDFVYYKYYFANPIKKFFIKLKKKIFKK